MKYYFEIWLRDFAKDYLRSISSRASESYHPHITIMRPFNIIDNEKNIRKTVVNFCKNIEPLPFYLEGFGDFDGKFYHVPVFEDGRLMDFNNRLENLLSKDVEFVKEIGSVKNFHVTIDDDIGGFDCLRINQYMLRLTGIYNKKIWFSYDFVTNKVLNRECSLDKNKWIQSVNLFTERYRILSANKGFKKV